MDHFTTTGQRLDRTEVASTALAVIVSTGLYLRYRHSYLARGVVGDIAGLAVCSLPLITRRRRLRHEALVCGAGIGAVYATKTGWPLRFSEPLWWSAIVLALTVYVPFRRLLRRSDDGARQPGPLDTGA